MIGSLRKFLPGWGTPAWWRGWTITARLVLIAVVPACLMFVVVTAALHEVGLSDLRRDIAERGRTIATALAQSSEYGVVSGNTAYLNHTLQGLLAADRTIAAIRITDERRRTLVEAGWPNPPASDTYEAAIQVEPLNLDPFDRSALPPKPGSQASGPARAVRTAGYVQVTMSTAPLLAAKRHQILLAWLFVLIAALFSVWVGLVLVRSLRHPLDQVVGALRSIRQGRYEVAFVCQSGELGELQLAITEMASALGASHHQMEELVARRTAELRQAMARLVDADAEKSRLIARGNALVEEERRRISIEIHDQFNATLISLRLHVMALVSMAKGKEASPEQIAGIAASVVKATESLYASARHIVKQLRPELIDTLGLAGALEEMVKNNSVHPSCRFTFRVGEDFPVLKGEAAMPAYRIAQEALSNVVKHAHATRCWVVLDAFPHAGRIRLIVGDNGCGFDAQARGDAGMGLLGMRERALAAGGEVLVTSEPRHGTTVSLSLPVCGQPEGASPSD